MEEKKEAPQEKEKEKLELEGTVEIKKSIGRRLADTFMGSDMDDVKTYLVQDIIVPAIKETVTNLVQSTLEMMFYGDDRRDRGVRRGRERGYTSYTNYSRKDPRPPFEPNVIRTRRDTRDISNITFTSKRDAQEVWNNLIDRTYEYDGVATVADLCDDARLDYTYTDNGYGWIREDLLKGDIRGPRNGIYTLHLPKPRPLD